MSTQVSAHRMPRHWGGASAALLAGLVAATAAASPRQAPAGLHLPPVTQAASNEHHQGKVIWMELVTPDMAGAKTFYGGLFGWTFQNVPGTRVPYTLALANGEPVASFVTPHSPRGGRRQPAWLPFLAAQDLNAIKESAVAHGARVLSEPRDYHDRGQQAVFADPQGAVFGVLKSASGDPPDELPDPGQWIWTSLLTSNAKSGAEFYQRVFGYETHALAGPHEGDHFLLSTEGFARASANVLPPGAQKDMPYWLGFVRVLDVASSVAKVKSLGGSVVTPPHPDRDGGMVAVVADPAGTPFGLMEWAQEASAAPAPEEHPR